MSLYFTTAETAERLKVAPQTLRIWRYLGKGPKYTKPSANRVLYAESAIEQFLRERTFNSTSEETISREAAAAGA